MIEHPDLVLERLSTPGSRLQDRFFFSTPAELLQAHAPTHAHFISLFVTCSEFSKVRTRSPTVHESELYQSRCGSVNTMSPSFKVDLTTFEDKIPPSVSMPDEIEQVQRVIMHHVTPLRKIYNKYATLGNEASPDNTYVLNRMQFWRLLKDARLHSPDLTLCMMDRALAAGSTGR